MAHKVPLIGNRIFVFNVQRQNFCRCTLFIFFRPV